LDDQDLTLFGRALLHGQQRLVRLFSKTTDGFLANRNRLGFAGVGRGNCRFILGGHVGSIQQHGHYW
jgi:hypothetical protein